MPDISIDWTPERGYPENVIKSAISPKPAAGSFDNIIISWNEKIKCFRLGSGSHLGLYVILNADVHDYYCSSTNSAGFKFLLHNPTETPRISDYGLLISPGRQTRIIITPKISTASRLIKKIPIEQRQCIFSNEANLTYFRWVKPQIQIDDHFQLRFFWFQHLLTKGKLFTQKKVEGFHFHKHSFTELRNGMLQPDYRTGFINLWIITFSHIKFLFCYKIRLAAVLFIIYHVLIKTPRSVIEPKAIATI